MARSWEGSTYGERVRHLAEMRGLSLNQLAALAGLPSGTISRLARHGAPVPDHARPLQALSETGQVSLAWLAFGQGQPDDAAPRHLRDRAGWQDARTEALAARGELAEEDVDAVGDMLDVASIPALDGPFVAGVASELAALRRRRAKVSAKVLSFRRRT